jgi:hypothetical protein
MKTLETGKLQTATPNKEGVAQDPGADLKQRLWQMLLPSTEVTDVTAAVSGSSNLKTSLSQSSDSQHDTRSRDRGAELAAAAYVLAGHIQQLSLHRPAQDDTSTPSNPPNTSSNDQGFNLQFDSDELGGGLASLDLSHPELGDIGLEVELESGAVRVTATATSERSARVIQAGQAVLAERLLRQGVALEALDVIVVHKQGPNQPLNGRKRARARRQES